MKIREFFTTLELIPASKVWGNMAVFGRFCKVEASLPRELIPTIGLIECETERSAEGRQTLSNIVITARLGCDAEVNPTVNYIACLKSAGGTRKIAGHPFPPFVKAVVTEKHPDNAAGELSCILTLTLTNHAGLLEELP